MLNADTPQDIEQKELLIPLEEQLQKALDDIKKKNMIIKIMIGVLVVVVIILLCVIIV